MDGNCDIEFSNVRLGGLIKYCAKTSAKTPDNSTSKAYSHMLVVASAQCNPMVTANKRERKRKLDAHKLEFMAMGANPNRKACKSRGLEKAVDFLGDRLVPQIFRKIEAGLTYRKNWYRHILRLSNNKLPRRLCNYRPFDK